MDKKNIEHFVHKHKQGMSKFEADGINALAGIFDVGDLALLHIALERFEAVAKEITSGSPVKADHELRAEAVARSKKLRRKFRLAMDYAGLPRHIFDER